MVEAAVPIGEGSFKRLMGATTIAVRSVDHKPQSVACTPTFVVGFKSRKPSVGEKMIADSGRKAKGLSVGRRMEAPR